MLKQFSNIIINNVFSVLNKSIYLFVDWWIDSFYLKFGLYFSITYFCISKVADCSSYLPRLTTHYNVRRVIKDFMALNIRCILAPTAKFAIKFRTSSFKWGKNTFYFMPLFLRLNEEIKNMLKNQSGNPWNETKVDIKGNLFILEVLMPNSY